MSAPTPDLKPHVPPPPPGTEACGCCDGRASELAFGSEGVALKGAAFTNFSRDHLDYHETMDAYFEAKMRLFEELLPSGKPAVVWTDDPKSSEVIQRAQSACHPLLTVGRSGDTIRLADQAHSALGQTLMIEHARPYEAELVELGETEALRALDHGERTHELHGIRPQPDRPHETHEVHRHRE